MPQSSLPKTPLDIIQIQKIIPHRFPMLLVDRVLEIDFEEHRIVALKNVSINESFFAGHYPDMPVMPGVLQIEAMAQAVCVFLLLMPQNAGKTPFFAGIDGAKFRRQVVPGDQLRIEGEMTRLKARVAKCKARCTVEGEVAAEAELTCMLGAAQ